MNVPIENTNNNSEKDSLNNRARQFYSEILKDGKATNRLKCNICDKQYNGTYPQNLVKHIKHVHSDIYNSEIALCDDDIFVQRLKMVHSCVELVTINSHPFSLLTQSGFRNAIEPTLRKFQLAGCPLNLSDHHVYEIKEKVNEVANKIRDQITIETKGKIVSVMVDGATRNHRSIFGVSLQYKVDGVLKVITVGMRELKKSHTASYLAHTLMEILGEYNISAYQILTITTDNGSNMIAMCNELEHFGEECSINDEENDLDEIQSNQCEIDLDEKAIENEIERLLQEQMSDCDALNLIFDESDKYDERLEDMVTILRNRPGDRNLCMILIRCAAHTLQLAVKGALKSLPKGDQNVIELCRAAAKEMRKQTTMNVMRQLNLSSILPKLDVKTRWSSTYMMVRFILRFIL